MLDLELIIARINKRDDHMDAVSWADTVQWDNDVTAINTLVQCLEDLGATHMWNE